MEDRTWASLDDAAWVFREDAIRTYELEVGDAEWAHLKAHALDEEYQPAHLRIEGRDVGRVGLRFKGSSTLNRCADEGRLNCPKLSMKIRFDEYDPSKRFYGLKRLNFNYKVTLHERLAYRMFREMGVQAPRAAHAELVVNGESLGLFTLVEAIDGRFTDDRFELGDGNLYKEQWPDTENLDQLSRRLRTNEEAPDHGPIVQFYRDLVAAAAEQRYDVVEHYMDVDDVLAFLAVDRAIANWDGVTGFYCRGACKNHNYYLYEHEGTHRFTLIPWDLDNALRVATPFDYVPPPLTIPKDCTQRYPVFDTMTVQAPGCDPVLGGLARVDMERYRAAQSRLLEGPFELASVNDWLDEREAELIPFVEKDGHGPGLAAFREHQAALRRDVRLLALRLRAERDGNEVTRTRLATEGQNDFESATRDGVALGLSARAAADTKFDIQLSQAGALAGKQDVSLSFEFRDAAEKNSTPWVRFVLPIDSPRPIDINAKTGLRLVLQSDRPRRYRVAFDSSGYSEYLSKEVVGWDVETDGTLQIIELAIADAKFRPGVSLPETPEVVLEHARELLIDPEVKYGGPSGQLGAGVVDRGRLRVDDIEFLP